MSGPWIDLLAVVLADTPRLPGALCRERPGLFDGDDDESAAVAADLCGRCPAREPCADWAATLRYDKIDGVIAGQRRTWLSHPSHVRKANQ